ncbi:hypothetical protein G4D82_01200 [Flavobacterium sp. CYK-4]|uniref:hypothetical protein n=1 Tax=Flavobacterium lotistagni TaxID=2709660 RepID=UPI0014073DFF|nr:hypothetical protein [Flavobacterium lotistagni]NHM05825.1 hypothetical protein [Flavobacterium lotistagni]
MKYRDLIIGMLLAVLASLLGSFIFIKFVAGLDFVSGFMFYKSHGLLGKIITLGAAVNLALFFVLLKMNKELMARGVVLGMFVLTIITLVI